MNKSREFDDDFFRQIIFKWKHAWMNQDQNSKEDYENYYHRAFGIDANMQYSLANRLVIACESLKTQDEEMRKCFVEMGNLLTKMRGHYSSQCRSCF